MVVITKVANARTAVIAIFPVRFAPPGNIGISPSKLFIKIKKNIVSRNGKNFSYFF